MEKRKSKDKQSQSKPKEKTTEFILISNNGEREIWRRLTNYKNLISSQLPKMPRNYITKTIFDGIHESLVAFQDGRIIGGACFRTFKEKTFAELVFMCID